LPGTWQVEILKINNWKKRSKAKRITKYKLKFKSHVTRISAIRRWVVGP
jgi:hypothetical protein